MYGSLGWLAPTIVDGQMIFQLNEVELNESKLVKDDTSLDEPNDDEIGLP
jgi:hypothetical protein